MVWLERDEDGMDGALGRVVALVEHGAPGVEQAQGGGGVGDFVAEVVGDAAVGVDALEVRAERWGGTRWRRGSFRSGWWRAGGTRRGLRARVGRSMGVRYSGGRAEESVGCGWIPSSDRRSSWATPLGKTAVLMSRELSALRVIMRAKTAGDLVEGGAAGDVVGALEASAGDELEGGAAGGGGVVEAGFEGDVAVVEAVGVELRRVVPLGGPPKKLTTPPLRTMATAHSHVAGVATASMTMSAPRPSGVRARAGGDYVVDGCRSGRHTDAPKSLAAAIWSSRLTTAMTLTPASWATCMNMRPMGPAPMTTMVSPGWAPLSSRPRTTQARGSVRAACSKGTPSGMSEGVLLDDAGGDADVFGVGSVVEEQVLAEVLLAVAAEEADVAGGGVEGDDAVAFAEGGDAGADFGDDAGELVAEGDGRLAASWRGSRGGRL